MLHLRCLTGFWIKPLKSIWSSCWKPLTIFMIIWRWFVWLLPYRNIAESCLILFDLVLEPNEPISCHWSLLIAPENIGKPEARLSVFQGVLKRSMAWTGLREVCTDKLSLYYDVTMLMPSDFLFSRGYQRDQWHEMG